MPQIIIKGMKKEDVQKMSKRMVDELYPIVQCPREYFTVEFVDATFIMDGDVVKSDPFIQINWFDRGQEVQDKVAAAITKNIYDAGYKHVDIFFTMLERNNYYENGEHL
jgi:hypothetical protein